MSLQIQNNVQNCNISLYKLPINHDISDFIQVNYYSVAFVCDFIKVSILRKAFLYQGLTEMLLNAE